MAALSEESDSSITIGQESVVQHNHQYKSVDLRSVILDHAYSTLLVDRANKYACETCKRTFPSKIAMEGHKRTHKSYYICPICSKVFGYKNKLHYHMHRYHLTPKHDVSATPKVMGKFDLPEVDDKRDNCKSARYKNITSIQNSTILRCHKCKKRFTIRSYASWRHIRTCGKNKNAIRYPCRVCGKLVSSSAYLKVHEANHAKQDNLAYECQVCHKILTRPPKIEVHKKYCSYCSICKRPYIARGRTICSNCPEPCDKCGKPVKRKRMSDHLTNNCLDPIFIICHICGICVKPNNWVKHESLHSCPMATCDQCGVNLKNKKQLNQHRIQIHGYRVKETVVCSVCSRSIAKDNLVPHMLAHERHKISRPVRKHRHRPGRKRNKPQRKQCPHCGVVMCSNYDLNIHVLRIHEKPFQCQLCPKAYGLKKTLDDHMNKHAGVNPYKCQFCSKAYPQKISLHGHVKRIHQSHS